MRKYFMAGVATAALMFGVSQAMAQSSTGGATDKAGASSTTSSPGMSGGASMDHSKAESSKTVGQARDQMKSDKGAESPAAGKMGAQPNATQNSAQAPSTSSSTKTGQQPSTMQNNAQGSSSSTTTTGSAASSATQLTTEQRTEMREKVLVNAPREANVNFSVNVGTVVPRTVHVAVVPETLIRIHPEWRSHKFFVVRVEIIIVDENFRIIAVLPV